MFNSNDSRDFGEHSESSGSPAKRQKCTHSKDSPTIPSILLKQELALERVNGSLSVTDIYSPNPCPSGPYGPVIGFPSTPDSSVASEDASRNDPKSAATPYASLNLHKMSVESLLTGPPGENPPGLIRSEVTKRQYPIGNSSYTMYGFDLGHPDFDSPKNNDANAIVGFSPPTGSVGFVDDGQYNKSSGFSSGTPSKGGAFENGGYYAKPVPIKISNSLGPLPRLLLDNPINLLYFHHFLNHTARILVSHDCEQNPFRNILPTMAVQHDNVLCLLLAFSASHRARLLNNPKPINRIAVWAKEVFPKLRQDLDSDPKQASDSTLATTIMLASLENFSPNTFEFTIPWQNHLNVARQLVIARGGPKFLKRADRVPYFLSRWFAYLDVLGSLSGSRNYTPLSSSYWLNGGSDEDFQIDCLLGFTSNCIGILTRIAELVRECESKRIDEGGNVREDWRPSEDVIEQAGKITTDLHEGLNHVHKECNDRSTDNGESKAGCNALEIRDANKAFHWAGLIHLRRRVLGKQTTDPDVQKAVGGIVGALLDVRRGSSAEACQLFPMITASCNAWNPVHWNKIMEWLQSLEGFGMAQVDRARTSMEKVRDTRKP